MPATPEMTELLSDMRALRTEMQRGAERLGVLEKRLKRMVTQSAMSEARDIRLKRLHMRSMRRGIKEMDLILSRFWAEEGAGLSPEDLDLYEALLNENDQELYDLGQRAGRPACPFCSPDPPIGKIKLSF